MQFCPTEPTTPAQIIESYHHGTFRIGGRAFTGAVLVSAVQTIPWQPRALDALTADDFAALFDPEQNSAAFDLLLFGTGARQSWPNPALRRGLRAVGLVLEVMDTGAACRTFNVLIAENRRVSAALLPVHS